MRIVAFAKDARRDRNATDHPEGSTLIGRLKRGIPRVSRSTPARAPSVAYVVFAEPLWHPLLRSQVVEVVARLRARLDVEAFYVLAFLPSRDAAVHRQALADVREELTTCGVTLIVHILPTLRRPWPPFEPKWELWIPHESRRVMPLAVCLVGWAVISLRFRRRVAIFHARSYPAAAAAVMAVRLVGSKLIFDARSPFPEENVVAGRWAENSRDFAFWKRFERRLLRRAAVTVAIAPTHERHMQQIEPAAHTIVIPNNVDMERFAAGATARSCIRTSLGVGGDEVLLCYLGSLNRTWNSPDVYAEFFNHLRGWARPHRLLLVVPKHDHPIVRLALTEVSLEEGRDYLLVHATLAEVPSWLSAADLGLQLFASPDVRVGVKVVEYLAAGLPVVTNRNVLGAAALVEAEGVGLVVEDGASVVAGLEGLMARRSELRDRCLALARSRFTTDRVADQYAAVYRALLTQR